MITQDLLRNGFTLRYAYASQPQRQRAWGLLVMSWVLIAGWIVYVAGLALPNIAAGASPSLYLNLGLAILPLAGLLTIWVLQQGRLGLAAAVFTGTLLLGTAPFIFTSPEGLLPLALIPTLVAGGVLLDRPKFLLLALAVLGALVLRAIWLGGVTQPYTVVPARNVDLLLVAPLVTFGLGAVFLYVFSGSSERIMNNTLDEALYMLAVAEHGTAPIDPADEQAVLSDLARRLQQRFRLYNMQTYLLNDEGQLVLHLHMAPGMPASSSQAPLVVGSKTLPGQAAALRQMITVDRHADEAVRALVSAGVRRAVAMPLLDDETLLGVVTAQSDSDTAFVPGEVSGLRLLVQQTTRMIGVARRLKTLTAIADEAKAHLSTLTAIMRAQEEQIRKDVKSGWNEYLKQHSTGSFGFDMEIAATSRRLLPAEDMPAELRATMERGEPIVEQRAGAQVLNMPIVFRGELLGAMSFTMPAHQRVTERQIELARGVIERLGAALENARLLEQTRAQAQREARASIVGTRLLGITDVQTVLDLAASEFQTALGAVYTRIYVQASAADDHTRTTQEAS